MRRYCGSSGGKGGNPRARALGAVLIAVGTLVLLLFVPYWVWTSVLSVILISVGFLLWRFN